MERFPVKTKDTAHRVLVDEAIVVNFRSSFFYNFNPVGTFIWDRCDGQHTLAQIAAAVAEEYEVPPRRPPRTAGNISMVSWQRVCSNGEKAGSVRPRVQVLEFPRPRVLHLMPTGAAGEFSWQAHPFRKKPCSPVILKC